MMGESAGRSRKHPQGEGADHKGTPAQRRGDVPFLDDGKMPAGVKGRVGLWVIACIVGAVMVLVESHGVVSVVGLALVIGALSAATIESYRL